MSELSLCRISLLILGLGTSGLGLSSPDRIVDGAPIDISKVPYMLSFRANNSHVCGAGIIDKKWGLTAAHCVIPFVNDPTVSISVRSGSKKYDYGGVVHNVTQISYHEKYNDENNKYDIAVFKVTPPFEFNNVTQPVKLPEDPKSFNISWGLVAGWGYFTNFSPILSENLQYVILPKVKWDKCSEDYKGRYEVTRFQVCYGFAQGGKDSCKGDSGGPLVNNFTVIGVTSWGADCAQPESPGVYTDVISLVEWIKNETNHFA